MESAEYVIVFERSRLTGTQVLLSINGKVSSPRLNVPAKAIAKPLPTAAPQPNSLEAVTTAVAKGARR
jgi:hypothetical protein